MVERGVSPVVWRASFGGLLDDPGVCDEFLSGASSGREFSAGPTITQGLWPATLGSRPWEVRGATAALKTSETGTDVVVAEGVIDGGVGYWGL